MAGTELPPTDLDDPHPDSEPDERSRLLPQPTAESEPDGDTPNEESLRPAAVFLQRDVAVFALLIVLLVLIVTGDALQSIPLNQVLQDVICRQLDPSSSDNSDCDDSSIMQAELALLRGWQTTFELIPGLLTAVLYGFMADTYGRKPVLCLCLAGIALAAAFYSCVCWWSDIFPVRLTWLSALFLFLGGGTVTLNSVLDIVLSDITSDAYRSTAFMVLGAANLVAELLINPLASYLMLYDPWIPILIGLGLYVAANILALAMPETLSQTVPPDDLPPDPAIEPENIGEQTRQTNLHKKQPLWSRLRDSLEKLQTATVFLIWGNRTVALLLLTLLTTDFGKMAIEVLLQFAKKRFGWSWSMAGYLVSFKAGVLLFLLSAVFPAINHVLTNVFLAGPMQRDLQVARITCLLLVLGDVTIAASPTSVIMLLGVVMWCAGAVYGLILRSLLALLVEPHHRGTLYTTIAILENAGAVAAGPLMALCFRAGLRMDGVWTGLPFMVAAALSSLSLPVLYGFIRIARTA